MHNVLVPFYLPAACIALGALLVLATMAVKDAVLTYQARKYERYCRDRRDAIDLQNYRAGFSIFDVERTQREVDEKNTSYIS